MDFKMSDEILYYIGRLMSKYVEQIFFYLSESVFTIVTVIILKCEIVRTSKKSSNRSGGCTVAQ